MATDLRNLPSFLSSDADFRAWGSGLAAQFAAMGLVQASDTGQINWTTVTRPAVGVYAGYEIWRFADSLQATCPVYMKFEYGVSSGAADRPSIRFQPASGTNGAGTLTGQIGTQRSLVCSTSKIAGGVLPSYCSGSPSRLNLATHHDVSSTAFNFTIMVERTRRGDGTETNDGFIVFCDWPVGSGFQIIPRIGTLPGVLSSNNSIPPGSGGMSSVGGKIALGPTIAYLGEVFYATWCCYMLVDLSELTAVTMTHLGAVRTYMPLGDGLISSGCNIGGVNATSIAMLWE